MILSIEEKPRKDVWPPIFKEKLDTNSPPSERLRMPVLNCTQTSGQKVSTPRLGGQMACKGVTALGNTCGMHVRRNLIQ